MMNEPNLRSMLTIAKGCGVVSLPAAFMNYTRYHNVFFVTERFHEQVQNLIKELSANGLTESVEGSDKLYIKDVDVEEVIKMLEVSDA